MFIFQESINKFLFSKQQNKSCMAIRQPYGFKLIFPIIIFRKPTASYISELDIDFM